MGNSTVRTECGKPRVLLRRLQLLLAAKLARSFTPLSLSVGLLVQLLQLLAGLCLDLLCCCQRPVADPQKAPCAVLLGSLFRSHPKTCREVAVEFRHAIYLVSCTKYLWFRAASLKAVFCRCAAVMRKWSTLMHQAVVKMVTGRAGNGHSRLM